MNRNDERSKSELFACPHHCPECQQGWLHDVIIAEDVLACRLKKVATCYPCLKEVARVFGPILNRVDAPLEGFWFDPEIQEQPV